MRRIETKQGLKTLLERMENLNGASKLEEFDYWYTCVKQCLESQDTKEPIAMDEVDYENAPGWFKPLWRGLK